MGGGVMGGGMVEGIEVIEGDCLEVLPTLEARSVDAIVTDPPYAIVNQFGVQHGAPGNGHRVLQFEWDTGAILETIVRGVEAAVALLRRPGAAFVFCGFDSVGPVQEVLRAADMTPKPYAWVKDCPPPPGKGNWWPSGFEIGVYAYHSGAWFGDGNPARCNVYRGDTLRHGNSEKAGHPTQKPLHIMRHLVRSLCPAGGLVIDPFAGSGTTGIACLKTGRRCILIERDPAYIPVIRRRLSAASTPLFNGLDDSVSGMPSGSPLDLSLASERARSSALRPGGEVGAGQGKLFDEGQETR